MSEVSTKLTLQGFEEPILGVVGVEGFDNPIISLEAYWNKQLPSQGTYDPVSKKLVFVVSGSQPLNTVTVKFSQISPAMSRQLEAISNGAPLSVTFKNAGSSLVGMHIEPVVQ